MLITNVWLLLRIYQKLNGPISMSDATGLVQRRRAAPKSEGDENNRGSPASGDRNEDDDAAMDHDSKETRLTLMEEVLLLGLKDKARGVITYYIKLSYVFQHITSLCSCAINMHMAAFFNLLDPESKHLKNTSVSW